MTILRRSGHSLTQPDTNGSPTEGIIVPAWMDDALCAQTDPEIFFPEKGGSTLAAKRVCAACPVRAECLEYALADERTSYVTPFHYGVYGGLSPRERRALLRERGAA